MSNNNDNSQAIAYNNKIYKTNKQVKTCTYDKNTHKLIFLRGAVYDSTNHKLVITQ